LLLLRCFRLSFRKMMITTVDHGGIGTTAVGWYA
jgi:hypothetical protein